MYNNQIAEVLKKTYGDEKFKIYCEMQILKSKLEDEQLRQTLTMNARPSAADHHWRALVKDRLLPAYKKILKEL